MITWLATYTETVLILAGSMIMLVILIYTELTRSNPSRKILRILLTIAAIAALTAAGLRPTYYRDAPQQTAILLTANYKTRVLDSILNAEPIEHIFSFSQQDRETTIIPSTGYLRRQYPDIKRLHILGDGIPSYEMSHVSAYQILLHLNPPPPGINTLNYMSSIDLGEKLILQGTLSSRDTSNTVTLRLAGETVDSIEIDIRTSAQFELAHTPVNPGTYLYQIQVKNTQDEYIQHDTIPLEVNPNPPLSILLIERTPGFETRYLKNWLASRQHPLIYRVRLTRDRYRTEAINCRERDLSRIRSSVLDDFDLMIIDSDGLLELSNPEKNAIRAAVEDDGLSLLILAHEALFTISIPGRDRSFFFDLLWQKDDITSFEWSHESQNSSWEKLPYHFLPAQQLFPLIATDRYPPALWYRRGKGKIGLSLITSTYVKQLQGEDQPYNALWTDMLRRLDPVEWDRPVWELPYWAYLDEPMNISVSTNFTEPQLIYTTTNEQSSAIALRQHPLLHNEWEATVWPVSTGWNHLYLSNDSSYQAPFYVFNPTSWISFRNNSDQEALKAMAHKSGKENPSDTRKVPQEIPRWIFYLIFLLAAGGLWLERKVS